MNALNEFELGLLQALQGIRNPFLNGFLPIFSYAFELGALWLILAIVLLFFPKHRRLGISILVAMGIGLVICNGLIKPLVMRDRPFWLAELPQNYVPAPLDYSFPSGLSTHSMIGACVIAVYHPKWSFAVFPIALLTAFSRVFFFFHFPTDVLVGMAIGALIGVLVALFTKKWLAQPFYWRGKKFLWIKQK